MSKKLILLLISFVVVNTIYSLHEQNKAKYTWQSKSEYFATNDMITVTSYNIRYGKGIDNRVNLERTIETLRSLDADIISLQEIERYSIRSKFQDQVRLIAEALDMNATFYPSLSYPGLYYGNAILSRFPIKDTELITFKNRREDRSAILSNIQLSNKQSIYVLNTHLGLNREERLQAIEMIHQKLNKIEGPILLKGDLNSLPKKQEYEIWNSYLSKSNEGMPIQTYSSRDWQIDYIFHSKEFVVNQTSVLQSEASDHYPISAVLSLQNIFEADPTISVFSNDPHY
ncbi:endonuclease/exonuclease/phosphatase family protein [Alkalihalobacterium alkalinitrilicum]|uniref:endonuclease/exonuclease/phosphatase family protein n=1 Tax=Alkalihalobacterium alkalinitrilicum TaxID=427920 RepID=UPI0009950712|nr:endonuclease/exonuclease/phosphatase family protein [Alkalihalobacterium alkalinitrilicum]